MTTSIFKFGAMRSVLYIPGDKERGLQKIPTLTADVVVLDLEDAVAPEKKTEARAKIEQVLADPSNRSRNLVIRINGVDTSEFSADLATVIRTCPKAILVPKYETQDSMQKLRSALREAQVAPTLQIWAMIETPRGIADIATLVDVNCSPEQPYPLSTLVIGTNDIARLTGTRMDHGRLYMFSWLSSVLIHAKARSMNVLDGVYNDFSNMEGFMQEVEQSRAMGFDGKTLIHPSQVDPTNKAFSPSEQEVAWATGVVRAFTLPENQGLGAINLNGGMVELLHLQIARRMLARR